MQESLKNINFPSSIETYVPSLSTEILDSDAMFKNNENHYFLCGASALSVILRALDLPGNFSPSTILDFGCGAGRVTRWLRAAFPNANIHACDIRESDLEFVKDAFNTETCISGIDIPKLQPLKFYDLIWVGSVFTHLSNQRSTLLYEKLMSWLNPGGFLIFSTHGRFVFHLSKTTNYGIDKLDWITLLKDYEASGYGYADYPSQSGYGISLSTTKWWTLLIENHPPSRLAFFSERAWDQHHDVFCVQKSDWS